ncbi:hypothetical protein ABT116_03685 [Streptomyces sp. NPDC002130]|uniref:hypothetical protein n=1 Tax=Streptomyces sp. NPDC002130 TaxID=3155568 RepID=UPI00331C034D
MGGCLACFETASPRARRDQAWPQACPSRKCAVVTAPVDVELDASERHDLDAALARTTVTTIDDTLKDIIEEGDFRAWKVFLHPAQAKLVGRRYSGPFRVSGGPGTGPGKTIDERSLNWCFFRCLVVRHLAHDVARGVRGDSGACRKGL